MKAGKAAWRNCTEWDSNDEPSGQMAFFPGNLKELMQTLWVPEKFACMKQGSKGNQIVMDI
jgi:hypothetical protein